MEFVVVAAVVVVVAFVAIALRFMPRDEGGTRRLPRMVDESVGMVAVRRVIGPRRKSSAGDGTATDQPTGSEIEPAPAATQPPATPAASRVAIPRGTHQAHPLSPGSTARPAPGIRLTGYTPVRGFARIRTADKLARERRIAAVIGVAIVAVAILAVALVTRGPAGGVLATTATPTTAESSGFESVEPTLSLSPTLSPSPTLESPDVTSSPSPTASPSPTPTPRPTPTRTPRPTPTRTPAPSPTAAPTPSPSPTAASPSPSASASPESPSPTAESPSPSSAAPSPNSPTP